MRFFVHPTSATDSKTAGIRVASIVLAAVFVILAAAQLFKYESFPQVIASLWLPGGHPFATLLAALLVTGEVFALPFLLSMKLSPAMRTVSMIAGWIVIAVWLKLAIYVNITTNAVTNSGVLGATVPVAPGWWLVGIFVLLGALCAWVSWGMWPFSRRATKAE